jgi:AcrR family transcriptional regulator
MRVFGAEGFSAARTADIARQTGVSHGAVFLHFQTRDELVAAVIEELFSRIVRRMQGLVEPSASLDETLAAHLRSLGEHESLYAQLVIEGPMLPPYSRAVFVGIQSAVALHIGAAAERETAAGTIRRLPGHLLFNTWIGLVHHYLVNRDLFAPGASVLKRHGEGLVQHFMGLLRP